MTISELPAGVKLVSNEFWKSDKALIVALLLFMVLLLCVSGVIIVSQKWESQRLRDYVVQHGDAE